MLQHTRQYPNASVELRIEHSGNWLLPAIGFSSRRVQTSALPNNQPVYLATRMEKDCRKRYSYAGPSPAWPWKLLATMFSMLSIHLFIFRFFIIRNPGLFEPYIHRCFSGCSMIATHALPILAIAFQPLIPVYPRTGGIEAALPPALLLFPRLRAIYTLHSHSVCSISLNI